jgi:hypothetical protein
VVKKFSLVGMSVLKKYGGVRVKTEENVSALEDITNRFTGRTPLLLRKALYVSHMELLRQQCCDWKF